MRRYWINFKGKQMGPLSLEELQAMGVDKTAYVWHSGLDDWVKITKVPELNEMLENMAAGVETATSQVTELPQGDASDDDVPELPPNYYGQPSNAMGSAPQQGGYNHQYASGGNSYAAQAAAETPECPPTNMVWAIISTICCCWPLGILAIFFAYKTKKFYKEGNYQKAEKFSEYGAWAIILSIVLGIISTPLACSRYFIQALG